MKKAFQLPGKDGALLTKEFEAYRRDGEDCCAVSYLAEGGALRIMTHGEYDEAISRYDALPDAVQAQYRREIRWDGMAAAERGRIPDPRGLMDDRQRSEYGNALAQAGLTHADRHAAAVRDACFNHGEGRREAVFHVAGRAIFESQMTPAVLAFSTGSMLLGDAKRLAGSKAWGKPIPARPTRGIP